MADITYLRTGMKKAGAPALPSSQISAVHCLMIPLTSDILLLPNAAIAEVAGYQQPEAVTGMPDWYLGQHVWRDYRIPVISFEILNGNEGANLGYSKNSRIAIFNTLNGNVRLPYIGVLAQGIPRLQVVQNQTLEENSSPQDQPSVYVSAFAMINGEPVTIPNIDMIERAILDLSQ